MAFLEVFDEGVPDEIRVRVGKLRTEVDDLYTAAMSKFATAVPDRISFTMSDDPGGDPMTPEERAQAMNFAMRFDRLRGDMDCHIGLSRVSGTSRTCGSCVTC
jgi:hypothetical protein